VCASCRFSESKPGVEEALTGNWIMLYPDHQRNDPFLTSVYAKSQDSIVNLMGLKLISFKEKGSFQLMDSLYRNTGKWNVRMNELQVTGAGSGWEYFNGRLIGFRNDTLQLVEYIPLQDDSVRIVWFMKKINAGDKASSLFEEENNIWRKKAVTKESRSMLAKKLKQVLEYYSLYFEVISEESMYFIGGRTPLPFRYYQHGAGLVPFDDKDAFSRLFYNKEDAAIAYDLLEDAYLKDRKKEFPKGDNYVIEYAKFLRRLAGRLD
jgi:hypothetical protein